MSRVELNILLFILCLPSSCQSNSTQNFIRILKKATNNTQGRRRRQRRRQQMTTLSLLVSKSFSAATAVFIGGGKSNNSNARRPRNQPTERSRHLSPRKSSTRAASLPPSRFNFTSSNQNNNSESSSSSSFSSYPNGNSHRLSAMEEERLRREIRLL